MNKVQLFRKRLETLREINKRLPPGWKVLLHDTIIGHVDEFAVRQGQRRIERLGEPVGYLYIKYPAGETSTIFDWQPGHGWQVNGKCRRSPSLLAKDVVEKVHQNNHSRQINFEKLYKIKSQNKGIVVN